MSGRLTHLDEDGSARMVDISAKQESEREAVAEGRVSMRPGTLALILAGDVPKGDVMAVARVAGIMAAKRTADIVPLCHPLALASVQVELEADEEASAVAIRARCRLKGRTGVEMEALTAVAAAALTVYDMCKAVDRSMTLENIRLLSKSGGRSGRYERGP